jgi:hypothetical protein
MANSVTINPVVRAGKRILGSGKAEVVELCLRRGEVRRLDVDAAGAQVAAKCGILWVTQEEEPVDVFLSAGERFTSTRPGRIVVQGMR